MPETETRHGYREQFLEMFLRELIRNSYDPKKDKELQEELAKDAFERKISESNPQKTASPEMNLPKAFSPTNNGRPSFQRSPPPMMPPNKPIRWQSPIPPPAYQPTQARPGQKVDTVNLGKLAAILKDPAVFSVECPGNHKNLLVNRSGSVQASSITLTPEEINSTMQNISNYTRIPLTPGVFRAAVQDLLVTAVISDFVGTRFLIQKRNPFTRY